MSKKIRLTQDDLIDLYDRLQRLETRSHDDPCISCGYCPHCGRTNYPKFLVGDVPPFPLPWNTTTTSGGTTVTFGSGVPGDLAPFSLDRNDEVPHG